MNNFPPHKRTRAQRIIRTPIARSCAVEDDSAGPRYNGADWLNSSLYVAHVDNEENAQYENDRMVQNHTVNRGQKRVHESWEDGNRDSLKRQRIRQAPETQDDATRLVPGRFTFIPSFQNRHLGFNIQNPFIQKSDNRHPCLKDAKVFNGDIGLHEVFVDGGYVRYRRSRRGPPSSTPTNKVVKANVRSPGASSSFDRSSMGIYHHQMSVDKGIPTPCLPPNFASSLGLDKTDVALFNMYLKGFGSGRTLLHKTNAFLYDIAPMAATSDCVKHAICALAAMYVLDVTPTEKLRLRANEHYRKAVALLDQALQTPENYESGKEDNMIAALIVLASEDIIHWEQRDGKDRSPRWRNASRIAKQLLDRSYKSPNFPITNARVSLTNMVAYIEICAHPVTPLELGDDEQYYSWVLTGTEEEDLKIHGSTGVCPRLLHMFALITDLAAQMQECPGSPVPPIAAKLIEERLENSHQWSELSQGYATAQELLKACVLDEEGKVDNDIKVTELTGETWVAAVQIYLQCRFYRRPRSHPKVQELLAVGLRCLDRMPAEGNLFTAQTPFLPIFLMAVVTVRREDRQVIRNWFSVVVNNSLAHARSSVPPVWNTLKHLWHWLDTELIDDVEDDDFDLNPIGVKDAWWERMVNMLMETEGQISLS